MNKKVESTIGNLKSGSTFLANGALKDPEQCQTVKIKLL